jgi:hypothetical protein
MVDVKNITFEQVVKKHFGNIIGQKIIEEIEKSELDEEEYEIKKRLVNVLALSASDDPQTEKYKIKAATTINAYWVWIVLGIKPATDLNQS